jgi:ubiquitin-like 1-activating enzyme E1 B
VFRKKIEALLLKEEMWEKRAKPKPLPAFRDVVKGESADDVAAGADATAADAQKVMTVEQAARVFVSSVARIMTRDKEAASKREDGVCGTDSFDKDDALAVDFVAAVSTLRSANYGIPPQSPFDVKGVAGNIVHAVATTNAIVGGLIVLEAMKILRKKKDAKGDEDDASAKQKSYPPCRYTFVKKRATNNRLLEPVEPDPPNASCAVCGQARLELVCDTESFTLGRLLHDVLKKKLGMHAPEINAPETVLYEHPEDLEEDEIAQYEKNLLAVLTALPAGGVRNGTELGITDFLQNFNFKLLVTHRPRSEWDEEEDPDLFILRGDQSAIGEAEEGDGAEGGGDAAAAGDDDDDFEIVDDGDELEIVESADAGTKRKRDASAEEGAEGAEKARRVE